MEYGNRIYMVTSKDFENLTTTLKLPIYDILIVGDGSGTTVDKPGGAACIMYDYANKTIAWYTSSFNHATNNFSELVPYIHALWAYECINKQSQNKYRLRVEIVSDSEVSVKCGNKEYTRNANAMLWASIDWFNSHGYALHWNWVPRNSNSVSTAMDELSKKMRLSIDRPE